MTRWLRVLAVYGLVAAAAPSLTTSVAHAQVPLVHIVRPGETLASIAELYYGDPRRESVLVAESGLSGGGGSAIVVGLRLLVPSVAYHRVEEGETWAELATRFYGDPSRAFVLIESNPSNTSGQPDVGAELLVPYPLRHVADQNESLRKIAKSYYKSQNGMNTIRRFNADPKTRLTRGQILLIPLADLQLTKAGKERAEAQGAQRSLGGDVRQKQAAIDVELPTLREHVRGGRYADAVAMAHRLIGGGDLTGSQVVSIHRELATALVALGRDDLAKDAFARMLAEQPDAELDGVRTSPKVLKVLDQARDGMSKTKTLGAKKHGASADPEPARGDGPARPN